MIKPSKDVGDAMEKWGFYATESATSIDQAKIDKQMLRVQKASLADRKSTRLNSSHVRISYAVFCLKKKKKKEKQKNKKNKQIKDVKNI